MASGVFARRIASLLLAALIICIPTFAHAQTPAATPAEAPATTQPVSIEDTIRAALPLLGERAKGLDAVNALQELQDEKVLRVFHRIEAKQLYHWKDQIVAVQPKDSTSFELFDIFADADDHSVLTGVPLATVPKAEVPESAALEISKPVRRQILDSLRILGLKIKDPVVRRKAAHDLGMKRQEDALPELQAIAKSDPNAAVRAAAEESVNLIIVASTSPSVTPDERVAAIKRLGELRALSSLDMLHDLAKQPNLPAPESAALARSIQQIERHASIASWLQNIFSSVSLGSIYVLLALGLAITFGLMGVINMAHGEMMMIGGITTWACYEFIGMRMLPAKYFDWYYVIAFPASFLTAALVGLLIETTVVRFLYKRPLDSLLATIGVGYVLIQAVRLWKGDNLGMRGPSWANGSWEIFPDVVLGYARLFIIGLTAFCILSVVALFRFTRIGLMVRATVQNREMAQALGVNTRMVDMFTFAFGAGLAGLAGYGIVLTGTNPTPEMGQTFIVKTFLTVVVGGVGKLAGVIVSGLGLGFIEKMLEPIVLISKPIKIFDATWSQVAALIIVVLFMRKRPSGLFPDKGRMADQADRISMPFLTKTTRKADWTLGLSLLVVGLLIVPSLYLTGMMSLEFVNKLGYILTFAICAIGLDLIWGYIGVLSLCQFMFFAMGGYAMGLYLINYGPMDGANHNIPRALFVVMSAVSGATPPWFLRFFQSFPLTIILGMLLPGALALLIGLSTFRSRVRGVYFSILTQAITVGVWLIFQKNELKLGGTNGLTNFTHILGFPLAAASFPVRGEHQAYAAWLSEYAGVAIHQTRFWLYVASFTTLMGAIVAAKALVHSGFGRVLVAIRDDETRLRFVGYQTWAYKAAAFTLAAMFGAIGGMLYAPQKGIITPAQIAAGSSILVVAWVAVGGRGSLWGAVFGAIFVSLLYEYMTSLAPEYWYFVLGLLFVVVPLLLPGGLMSLPKVLGDLLFRPKAAPPVEAEIQAKADAVGGH
ncbi:hypothetical protein BH10PLA1_BH10PLA1_14850 [soil metagenome]